jgi:mannan endo-1,4-beta-mannosidase
MNCYMRLHLVHVKRALAMLVALTVATALATTGGGSSASAAIVPAPPGKLVLGAYASGFTGAGTQLTQFERGLGSKVAIASSFRGWGDLFPDAAQRQDAATGHTLLIAWDLGQTTATRFTTFTRHLHDRYLAQEAAAARSYGKPLYIRPWAEMNGDWSAFQPTPTGNRPAGGTYAQFIAAWRYLVTFFRNHGATNVRWVFNPTTDTYAQTTPVNSIWPGAAYVNVLGLDGYNWGRGGPFVWRSFSQIYATQYSRLVALHPTAPVWICEVGSKAPNENDGAPIDPAHTKSAWYAEMFRFLATSHVRALVMFDVRKERDWRIESDPVTLTFMRTKARAIAAG